MRFTLRLLGAEVLHVNTDPDPEGPRGDAMSTPVGFTYPEGER